MLAWSELVRHAGSVARARTLLQRAEWWQVCRGAYAPWHVDDGPSVRARALRRLLPPDVALSHRSALWLLGLDVLGEVLDVSVDRGRQLDARPGLRTHTARLDDQELCVVGGLLVVSPARAVLDVARSESLVEAVAVADAVLRSGWATVEGLEVALDRSAGLRGVRSARQVLAHAEPRSESPQESRLRMQLVLGGVPRPVAQHDVYGPSGHVARVDLWLDGLVIEFDGREVHLQPGVFAQERHRQAGLLELDLEVRRYTGVDVYRRGRADLCAEVLRAWDQARRRTRPALRSGPDTLPRPRYAPPPVLGQRPAA